MRTIDICSNCHHQHNWKEIDYDNVLYVSEKNAICLTLCQSCTTQFLENYQNKSSIIKEYKQKIGNILLTDRTRVLTTNNAIFGWFSKSW
ncbi:MAG TPA: hypothetical protein VN698_11805 [Bacteroidia bacterium]|nr:hypothetical protein [Bacteroidia bacterium]